MQNTGYVNITAGISNPLEIAVPPAGCENAPLVQAHYVSTCISMFYVNLHFITRLRYQTIKKKKKKKKKH